jgi:hypothetical protein
MRAPVLTSLAKIAFCAAPFITGCLVNTDPGPQHTAGAKDPVAHTTGAFGPVASNAAAAWPTRPTQITPLTAHQILEGCANWAQCAPGTAADQGAQFDICVGNVKFSGERAMPLVDADERAEFFVRCAAAAGGDCAQVNLCLSKRSVDVWCEEDGCKANIVYAAIRCEGSVAVMKHANGTEDRRDCSRAFLECDATSETGCTDRHFTQCDPNQTKADRCDGNIRLGCDGAGQVSYHDCSLFGGTCGDLSYGGKGCVYPEDAACKANQADQHCEGDVINLCFEGRLATYQSTLCKSSL